MSAKIFIHNKQPVRQMLRLEHREPGTGTAYIPLPEGATYSMATDHPMTDDPAGEIHIYLDEDEAPHRGRR